MGLRQWFIDVQSRGAPIEVDPDAIVEADLVPLPAGPMLLVIARNR